MRSRSSFVAERRRTYNFDYGYDYGHDMDIKTYRAKTMRDALELVRRELGP